MVTLGSFSLVARKQVRTRVASAALTIAAFGWGCSPSPKAPEPAPSDAPATAIGGPNGRFVGSAACQSCHAEQYKAWSSSRHRTTLRPWSEGQPLRLAAGTIEPPYRVGADGIAFGPGTDGKEAAAHVAFLIGGRRREDALVRLADGRIQVFPVSFDVDRGQAFEPLRELAGGTRPPTDVVEFWTRAGRNADIACYGCHATGQIVEVVGRAQSELAMPGSKWVEPGVGCEACHGPGGPHVDAAKSGTPLREPLRMVHADPLGTIDACAACHGLRDVLPSPFGDSPAHRYGESIVSAADPLLSMGSNSEFRDPFFADLRPSTYQQEAIAFSQSGCALKGKMTCAACHDVHSGAPAASMAPASGGSAICAPCHAAVVALGEKHTSHAAGTPGSRCLDCHMAPILRGPGHEAARDHSMAPPVAGHGQIPAACVACHGGSKQAAKITRAWEHWTEGPAAKRRLEVGAAIDAAAAGAAGGPALLAQLAGDPGRGWFIRWAALQKLAAGRAGKAPAGVLETVRHALADPNPAIRRAAARALATRGESADIELLQRATDDTDPWTALEAAHAMGQLGAVTAGARLLQLMKRPDLIADARAQYMYGHACLVGQDSPRAESALRRALELNPIMVGAINDLGLALLAQGKRDEAITAWKRALNLNPRFTAARRNLESTKP